MKMKKNGKMEKEYKKFVELGKKMMKKNRKERMKDIIEVFKFAKGIAHDNEIKIPRKDKKLMIKVCEEYIKKLLEEYGSRKTQFYFKDGLYRKLEEEVKIEIMLKRLQKQTMIFQGQKLI